MTLRRTKAKRRTRSRRDKGQGVSLPGRSRAEEKPYRWTEGDVERLRELHARRSYGAQRTDEALVAPIAPSPTHWIRRPGEYDVYGVDYPEHKARRQHERRSDIARATDLAKKAPLAPTPEAWARHPDRYDLPGVDTPQKARPRGPKVDERNPMGTPDSAKKYLADVVEKYRRKLGVKGEVKLRAQRKGYPARIRHFGDGGTPRIEVNYRHFGLVWERDPGLTKRYLEYMVAHELAHQKQKEELGYTGLKKANQVAKAEVEVDADNRAYKAMGVTEKELERLMDKLARRSGGVHVTNHPGFKGTPNIGRFKDRSPHEKMEPEKQEAPEKPIKVEEPKPKPSLRELRERMKATYGKALGEVIPAATRSERELIAEKAIAEEWIKPDDTAKTATAKITERARAELVKMRQEKAAQTREEQLRRLKVLRDKAAARKTEEDRLRERLALLREEYGAQYEAYLGGALSQLSALWRRDLYKALQDKGCSREEAAQISASFNEDAVRRIQAEALAKARKEAMDLADDSYGEVPELWEEGVKKTAAGAAERHAKAAVEAAYREALGSVRGRAEPPKPVAPIQPRPTVKTSSEGYDFYADPGHGWLRVPLKRLEELGIENDISPYSYVKGGYAYLEEDRDARIFTEALEGLGVKVGLREHTSNRDSAIRGYQPYRKPKQAAQYDEATERVVKSVLDAKPGVTRAEVEKLIAAKQEAAAGLLTDAAAAALVASDLGVEKPAPTPDPSVRSAVAGMSINDANDLIRDHVKAHCPTVSVRRGTGTAGGWLDIQGSGEYGRFTDQERQQLAAVGLQVGNTNSYPMEFDEKVRFIERNRLLAEKPAPPEPEPAIEVPEKPKPIEAGVPSLKKATASNPVVVGGMYEVEVYNPGTREKTVRRFSTPDKAEQYRRLVNDNPGWPLEGFKERRGHRQGKPKYMIVARNVKSRGAEAVAYTVYDRDKSDQGGRNEVARGTIEYSEAPGRERIVEDLVREAPKGASHEVDFTVTPHWAPALSMVERITPASPTGERDGKWMVWFKNREGRDVDPREGVGSRSFDTYGEALDFAREGRGRYHQGDFEREGIWLTVTEPPALPEELRSFTGKQERFEVDPRPQYEGTWDQEKRGMEYRWVFKNTTGPRGTHTLDELREERQRGEWRRRDSAEAAKRSRTLTYQKGAKRGDWDRRAMPLASAVAFNDHAVIEAQGDRVAYEGMDPSHVALMKFRGLPNEMGIPEGRYEAADANLDNRVTHLRHPRRLEWDNVERALRVANKDQMSYIRYEKVHEFKNRFPEPRVSFTAKARLDVEALRKALDAPGIEHIAFKVSDGRSALGGGFSYEATRWETRKVAHGEGEEAWESEERVEVPVSGKVGEVERAEVDEVKATYTVSYVRDGLEKLVRAGFRDASIEFATDMPLKISAKRDDGAEAEFWLAPCIGV